MWMDGLGDSGLPAVFLNDLQNAARRERSAETGLE
jgi:hypothetical protein